MNDVIHIDGQPFDPSIEHFSFPLYHKIHRMDDLRKLALLPNLKSANFCGTNLNDVGLEHISHATNLEGLDLQDTKISNDGLAHLASLPWLHWLRLKENGQLTNECVPHLMRLESLVDLQIHETSIDQHGLQNLEGMTNLRNLIVYVWNNNYTFDGLLALSARMPNCTILAKGHGEFLQGRFDGKWTMTEKEWLIRADPTPMLDVLRGKASERKTRLFAAACCRRIWHLLTDERMTWAVESAERYADRDLTQQDLVAAFDGAELACIQAYHAVHDPDGPETVAWNTPTSFLSTTMDACAAACATSHAANPHDPVAPFEAARYARDALARPEDPKRPTLVTLEQKCQADLLRCIIGNPFRPVTVDSSWLTSNVTALAQAIYDERAFDRLPILADALEDAGCTNAELLGHCRGPGPHVHGCWVVDLLLKKE